jgi:flagellar basal body rod protein FlgG
MNYGYQLAASGVMTAMYRQDVAANNLANVETVGFKPDMTYTVPREAARIEDRLGDMPSNKLLERLGAGVLLAPNSTSFTQGSLTRTSNDLDVAIRGEGFLTVAAGGGSPSGQQVRLTRDGRLTLNSRGELVTATGGLNVLDDAGRAITLEPGEKVAIDGDGTIRQGGAEVARIRLVNVANKSQLRKVGHNLYAASATALNARAAAENVGELVQGHLESSAVDTIRAMMAVQTAANAVSSATRIMSIHDEITGRLINSLGRVSA